MLLAIDIGNTNITLGFFKFDSGHFVRGPVNIWRLNTDCSKAPDEYGTKIQELFHYPQIDLSQLKAVVVASVVPMLNRVFENISLKYFKNEAFFIEGSKQKLLKILYDNPQEVGADRVANAVAAYEFFGGPVIVVDFGTATTFDCISKKREYLGGVVVPGPSIAAEALYKKTAKLPMVEIAKPDRVIGKSTEGSIQSGLYYGYIGLIKEVLKRIGSEISGKPKVIATGGLADLIVKEIKDVKEIVPELTLEGIRIIWENSQKKSL